MAAGVYITSDANFDRDITTGLVLVDFWAEWCGPCRMMIPELEKLAPMMGETAKIMKMNVDENPMVPQKFRIMSIPTMILFKDGQPVEKFVGVRMADDLKNELSKYL